MKKAPLHFITLLFVQLCFTQNWEVTTDFPYELSFATSFVLNNELYIGSADTDEVTDSFYKFNESTLMWEFATAVPYGIPLSARVEGTSFVINGKAYLTGGIRFEPTYPNPADLWEYDPNATPAWTRKTDNPVFASFQRYMISFVINNKAYIKSGDQQLNEYDPATDTWTSKANFPGTALLGNLAFSLNGKGYVGTGFAGSANTNEMYEYDPNTDTWTAVANCPIAISDGVAFTYNGKAYVGMGNTGVSSSNEFYAYDPTTNTWASANSGLYNASEIVAGVTNDYVYVGTGLVNGLQFLDDVIRAPLASLSTPDFNANSIEIYPNPTADRITINGLEQFNNISYTIHNTLGQKVDTGLLKTNTLTVDHLNAGSYIMTLNYQNKHYTHKLIVM